MEDLVIMSAFIIKYMCFLCVFLFYNTCQIYCYHYNNYFSLSYLCIHYTKCFTQIHAFIFYMMSFWLAIL